MRYVLYCSLILGTVLIGVFPSKLYASREPVFHDDFDQGLSESWEVLTSYQWANQSTPCYYYDQPAEWTVQDGALSIEILGPGCVTEIGVPDHKMEANKHYEVSFEITLPHSIHMDRNYLLRFHNKQEFLAVKLIGTQIFLEKATSGSNTISNAYGSYPFEPNSTYAIRNVLWANGEVEIYINDEKILFAREHQPWVDGAISGFRASVGAISYSITQFDTFLLQEILPDQNVQHSYISQLDSTWSAEVYDRATTWSSADPTIGRWGCALTSAAITLHAHGITTLPDDQPLNPSSLNTWLSLQQDGYIADGLVNWLAITRLSRVMHQLIGTPTLEFTREEYLYSRAQQLVQTNRYPILDVVGHFVFASDEYSEDDRLLILDPALPGYRTSTEYSTIRSMRVFTPSNTDLSYLLVILPAEIQAELWYQADIMAESFLEGPYSTYGIPDTQLGVSMIYLPKPSTGLYELQILNSAATVPVEVFQYNKEGEVVVENYVIHPEDNALLLIDVSHEPLLESIESVVTLAWQDQEISRARTYLELKQIAQYIDHSSETDRERYRNWFQKTLMEHSEWVNESAKAKFISWLLQESNL